MEISVIITNYNYERYISRAIRSAINQSYDHSEYEIIVIDDASTDKSQATIKSFGEHIRPIINSTNMGLAASCNKAFQQALGKYIIRLDSDDFVHKDWLKIHQLFLASNKEMNATSSDYYEVDEKEQILIRKNGITWPIACNTMFRLDDIIDLGLYDDTLPREDFDFRERFLKSGRQIYNIPVPLYRYSKHNSNMTRTV